MLETTSYAILPSQVNKKEELRHPVQSICSYEWDGKVLSGMLSKGSFFIYFTRENTLRFAVQPFGEADVSPTIAAERDQPLDGVTFEPSEDSLVLEAGAHRVTIFKNSLSFSVSRNGATVFQTEAPCVSYTKEKQVYFSVEKETDAPIYGLGEKSGFINKNGLKISNWNTDVFAPHNKDTVELYQSIPFALIHAQDKTTGIFFDNTFRTSFDMQTYRDKLEIMAEGGQVNVYVIWGEDVKETVQAYTDLTGKTPLPPKWSLGYHQSRYSYTSQDEVSTIAATFKKYGIPLDCIFLDIHYMDDYRVFTFNEDTFPGAGALVKDLNSQGIDVVPIVDPGVKKDVHYPVYVEGMEKGYFSKYLDGDVYYGEVWPGESAFPDFFNSSVQKWWGGLHQYYTKLGIRGIWNDMNEPSVFNETKTMDLDVMHDVDGKKISHKEGHNLYGLYMSKATFEGLKEQVPNSRPFSLTRAGYAGVQRYSAVWTGDNRSHWEHLEMSLPMIINLGLSGVAFSGADVGGFSSDTTPELLIRWTQVGAFLPYFRNHSVQDSIYQEPWAFGEATMESVKKYIELRYRFMPYLYTLFHEAEQTGLPVVRPLVMEYPQDEETFQCSDQFLLGKNVLVAPILRQGQTHRAVYLPAGEWYDFWTEERYKGGEYHLIKADLDTLPLFVKEGTILPLGSPVRNTKEKQEIELHIYHSEQEVTGILYEDDGISYDYRDQAYSISTYDYKKGDLQISREGSYEATAEIIATKIIGKNEAGEDI
ncbi:glycoside hydrolase family 31 protein [Thalassobacillus hwangdonensis]|uniref:TIM-barrel domain-containing protein n=1 Tax=Thalassobacillus hwangdonensis TaxID=546108 RepID=A0ABW3L160_9BACI